MLHVHLQYELRVIIIQFPRKNQIHPKPCIFISLRARQINEFYSVYLIIRWLLGLVTVTTSCITDNYKPLWAVILVQEYIRPYANIIIIFLQVIKWNSNATLGNSHLIS